MNHPATLPTRHFVQSARRASRRSFLAVAVVTAGSIVLSIDPDVLAAGPAPAFAKRSDDLAEVTVSVTPKAASLDSATWAFDVSLETHTKNLDDDLVKNAVLVTADGKRIRASAWEGPGPGGHHRAGVLRFPAPQPTPAAFALEISRAGESAPRVFRWQR